MPTTTSPLLFSILGIVGHVAYSRGSCGVFATRRRGSRGGSFKASGAVRQSRLIETPTIDRGDSPMIQRKAGETAQSGYKFTKVHVEATFFLWRYNR
jgi:hypothetical protein